MTGKLSTVAPMYLDLGMVPAIEGDAGEWIATWQGAQAHGIDETHARQQLKKVLLTVLRAALMSEPKEAA